MTPLELASDLEAKHKALKPSMPYADRVDAVNALYRVCYANLPTILTALRESGEAIERAAKVADRIQEGFHTETQNDFDKRRVAGDIARAIRAERPR